MITIYPNPYLSTSKHAYVHLSNQVLYLPACTILCGQRQIWNPNCLLTHWSLGDETVIKKNVICKLILQIDIMNISHESALKWMPQEPWTISQHWFKQWLVAARQQSIAWVNVDADRCHHMALLGHSEWIFIMKKDTFCSYLHMRNPGCIC